MSTEPQGSSPSNQDTVPSVPATTPSLDSVPEMLQLLDRLEALIPDYAHPDPAKIRIVASNARFAGELIRPAITAFNAHEPFRERKLFNVAAGNSALEYRDGLEPVSRRLTAIALGLAFSINEKLATSAAEALQMYQWAKRHVKQPEGLAARTYVDEMQRVVARTIRRRPKSQQPTEPPPASKPPQGFLAGSLSGAAVSATDDDLFDVMVEIAEEDTGE